MPLHENLIWLLLFLFAVFSIYGYRILYAQALKAFANSARIQSNPKALKKLNKKTKQDTPSFILTLVGVFLSVSVVFSVYKYLESNRINTTSKFQAIATTAMQNDCTTNCSVYGITQDQLIGPQLEQECCYGRPDYIFTWQSNDPKVILKEHVTTSGIDAVWLGERVQEDVESTILVRNDMNSIIRQNQNKIDNAYKHALNITPSMHASFAFIHLTIAPNGQVTHSNIILTDINSVEFKNNLLKIFNNLRFSSGPFQTMEFTYRVRLQPIQSE